jgi:hypothetical protein
LIFNAKILQNSKFSTIYTNTDKKETLTELTDYLKRAQDQYLFLYNIRTPFLFLKRNFEKLFDYFFEHSKNEFKIEAKPKSNIRYNFASMLGGAKILEKNSGCFQDKSILDDNPDKYEEKSNFT